MPTCAVCILNVFLLLALTRTFLFLLGLCSVPVSHSPSSTTSCRGGRRQHCWCGGQSRGGGGAGVRGGSGSGGIRAALEEQPGPRVSSGGTYSDPQEGPCSEW